MKKSKTIGLSFLSALVLFSLINSTVAAPPSYVGVNTGDEYVWTASVNMQNVNTTMITLFGQDNWTLIYNMALEAFENATTMDFSLIKAPKVKGLITNATDEMTSMGIRYSGVQINISYLVTGNTYTDAGGGPMIPVINPADINETTWMYLFQSFYPLLMPIGLNYTFVTEQINNFTASDPYLSGNFSYTTEGTGFKITIVESFLNMTLNQAINNSAAVIDITGLGDAVFTVRWNDKGILDLGSLAFGGLEVASIKLGAGIIPGYELPILLGVTALTTIGLIAIIRKKKRMI